MIYSVLYGWLSGEESAFSGNTDHTIIRAFFFSHAFTLQLYTAVMCREILGQSLHDKVKVLVRVVCSQVCFGASSKECWREIFVLRFLFSAATGRAYQTSDYEWHIRWSIIA